MKTEPARRRALVYITRENGGETELLVFSHKLPRAPEAGVQVPGGTIDAGETPETGARREAFEESGLANLGAGRLLASDVWQGSHELLERHFYQFRVTGKAPDAWDHTVTDGEGDRGMVFHCFWVPLSRARDYLAGVTAPMGDYLHLLSHEPHAPG